MRKRAVTAMSARPNNAEVEPWFISALDSNDALQDSGLECSLRYILTTSAGL
jgi:hypothetical protein